ncbi:hypothetical protein CHS0354_033544 [Potamilus streckersoni]|uniref:Uncharacterized protein n=1 Tax=Potamilus streckersoni TaxID=2493646 RepID=A0AAE0W538_9BIVA|nr:hypothetical protein CHS0354_033544 [Potamilus streckersoni]
MTDAPSRESCRVSHCKTFTPSGTRLDIQLDEQTKPRAAEISANHIDTGTIQFIHKLRVIKDHITQERLNRCQISTMKKGNILVGSTIMEWNRLIKITVVIGKAQRGRTCIFISTSEMVDLCAGTENIPTG